MGKIKYNIEEFIKKTPIFDINSLKKPNDVNNIMSKRSAGIIAIKNPIAIFRNMLIFFILSSSLLYFEH